MATVQGIRAAHARYGALWGLTRSELDRLAEAIPQWSALCREIADDELLRRVEGFTGQAKPTLSQILGAKPKAAAGSTAGCSVCDGSGRRQVLRWVQGEHGPTCQELTVRCPCHAGEAMRAAFPLDLPTWMERWTRSPNTIDGPYADPDPAHRVEPSRRREFVRAAASRIGAVEAILGRSCA